MEHASSGDDAACAEVLRDLIARSAAKPYVPAFLQAGQALIRLDRVDEAASILRTGVDAARRAGDLHAQGEMQGLLDSIS
jgi:hypothetical protein